MAYADGTFYSIIENLFFNTYAAKIFLLVLFLLSNLASASCYQTFQIICHVVEKSLGRTHR